MNNDKEFYPKDITKRTPFHLEPNWDLILENHNKSCSHTEIDRLLQRRIINLIDMELIRILACFPFTNNSNLSFMLNKRLHPGYHKTSYLDNLNKLKNAGIVLRYFPAESPTATNSSENCTISPAGPLRLYTLSISAYTYIESLVTDSHKVSAVSPLQKIELAALNQFLIHFQSMYADKVLSMQYQKRAKIGSTSFFIDAILNCHATHPIFESTDRISLYLLSVRAYGKWEKNILLRLKMLRIWLERCNEDLSPPFILLLVESLAMALTIFSQMLNMPALEGMHVYFCPDSLLMQYSPLDALYSCKITEEGFLTAIHQSISF